MKNAVLVIIVGVISAMAVRFMAWAGEAENSWIRMITPSDPRNHESKRDVRRRIAQGADPRQC